jgi:hypothetical protein
MGQTTNNTSTGSQATNQLAAKLVGPGTYANRMLSSMPVDDATRNRIAGQTLTAISGGDLTSDSDIVDALSYTNTGIKLPGSKYTKQGLQSGSVAPTIDYTSA